VTFNIGDSITTTVYMIGDREEEVTGTVTRLNMSRKTPDKVLSYVIDATAAGHGMLIVEAAKARQA
jgi:hypothetical protein